MSTEPVESQQVDAAVVLEDAQLRIRDLVVDGDAFAAANEAVEQGRDLELVVRRMLETGGAVLLHGAGKATVDAVAAEVERLLTALTERGERIEAVRRTMDRVPAKGLAFEERLGPVLDACFSSHHDVLAATGATTGIGDDMVGDSVLTVNPRDTGGRELRIVFEAKDQSLTMSKALAELDAAMLNRGADVGVMVFAGPAQANDMGLDRAMLADRLAKLVNPVERADRIQRGVRSARRGLDTAEEAYLEMHNETMALLLELQDQL